MITVMCPPPPKHSPCPLTHTHPPCVHRLSQRECGDHKQSKTEAGPVIMIMITIFLFGLGIFSELAEFVVPPPPQLTMPTMFRSCKMVLVVVTRPPQRWWCCWCILTPACMIDRITRAHSVCDFFLSGRRASVMFSNACLSLTSSCSSSVHVRQVHRATEVADERV
jgi:hypothetical protein